jgi:acetate kinase
VFTGGIGENAGAIRQKACEGLRHIGISIDPEKNSAVTGNVSEIQKDGQSVSVLVIRTDEEREIAQQTINSIEKAKAKNS